MLEPGAIVGNAYIMLFGAEWMLGWLGMRWMFAAQMPEDGAELLAE